MDIGTYFLIFVISMYSDLLIDFFSFQGQNGFDDLRRYVKQGGDFCKELATILQER